MARRDQRRLLLLLLLPPFLFLSKLSRRTPQTGQHGWGCDSDILPSTSLKPLRAHCTWARMSNNAEQSVGVFTSIHTSLAATAQSATSAGVDSTLVSAACWWLDAWWPQWHCWCHDVRLNSEPVSCWGAQRSRQPPPHDSARQQRAASKGKGVWYSNYRLCMSLNHRHRHAARQCLSACRRANACHPAQSTQ